VIYTNKWAFIHVPKTSGTSVKQCIELNCPDNPNYTITEEDEILHGKYMTYRQELRDMLKDYVPVSAINWPTHTPHVREL